MVHGKTITVFWVNGTPNGIITAELASWNGKGIKIPREEVVSSKRPELQSPGVYFLFCSDTESGNDSVYIGESENLQTRLIQHLQDYKAEKEKYYWDTVVAFTGLDLNKNLVRYLEYRLVVLAKEAKRYQVLTKATCKDVIMKEYEKDNMEAFIDNIKTLLSSLNYRVLEPINSPKQINNDSYQVNILHLKTSSAEGHGYITEDNQFMLMSGSKPSTSSAKSCPACAAKLRKQKQEDGLIQNGITTEDLLFKSSSVAASFLAGFSISGPANWKDSSGKSLKIIQQEESD